MTGFGLTKQLYINLAKQRLKSQKTDLFAYGQKLEKGADRRQRKDLFLEGKEQETENILFLKGKKQQETGKGENRR